MNLFDDFTNSNSDFLQSTLSNVFQTFATDTLQRNGLIKSGNPANGNPGPGQVGVPTPVYAASTSGLERSSGFGGIAGMDSTTTMLVLGGVAIIVLVFVLKK